MKALISPFKLKYFEQHLFSKFKLKIISLALKPSRLIKEHNNIMVITKLVNLNLSRSHWLPERLRNWDFLPLWMHSLDPLDKFFSSFACCSRCHNVDDAAIVAEAGQCDDNLDHLGLHLHHREQHLKASGDEKESLVGKHHRDDDDVEMQQLQVVVHESGSNVADATDVVVS